MSYIRGSSLPEVALAFLQYAGEVYERHLAAILALYADSILQSDEESWPYQEIEAISPHCCGLDDFSLYHALSEEDLREIPSLLLGGDSRARFLGLVGSVAGSDVPILALDYALSAFERSMADLWCCFVHKSGVDPMPEIINSYVAGTAERLLTDQLMSIGRDGISLGLFSLSQVDRNLYMICTNLGSGRIYWSPGWVFKTNPLPVWLGLANLKISVLRRLFPEQEESTLAGTVRSFQFKGAHLEIGPDKSLVLKHCEPSFEVGYGWHQWENGGEPVPVIDRTNPALGQIKLKPPAPPHPEAVKFSDIGYALW